VTFEIGFFGFDGLRMLSYLESVRPAIVEVR